MNAAIEAAHAGAYGAGFAVVADEIRKLADASGTNSKRISGVLKDVVERIEHAGAAGEATRAANMNINNGIRDVSHALDEISGSMSELNTGGRQILEAMSGLRGYAAEVQDGGMATAEASDRLEKTFGVVESVCSEVLASMGEIDTGLEEIKTSVASVSEISDRLSGGAELLDKEVARFVTDREQIYAEDLSETAEEAANAVPELVAGAAG